MRNLLVSVVAVALLVAAWAAPAAAEPVWVAGSLGPSVLLRASASLHDHPSLGGALGFRIGEALTPRAVLFAGTDLYVYKDEASCGDCIYDAPGGLVTAIVGTRLYASERVWLEFATGLVAHLVSGTRSVGLAFDAGLGVDLTGGPTRVSLEARIEPMYLTSVVGDEMRPVVAPIVLGIGVVH